MSFGSARDKFHSLKNHAQTQETRDLADGLEQLSAALGITLHDLESKIENIERDVHSIKSHT